jgi:hypothetical protein
MRCLCLCLLLPATVLGTMIYPAARYGQEVTVYFSLYDSNAPWQFYETAPAAADVHIRKDGGSEAHAANSVTDLNHIMSLTLTATEMQAKVVTVDINDASVPALYGSATIVVPTFGNASAWQVFDVGVALPTVDANEVSADLATTDDVETSVGTVLTARDLTLANVDLIIQRVELLDEVGGVSPNWDDLLALIADPNGYLMASIYNIETEANMADEDYFSDLIDTVLNDHDLTLANVDLIIQRVELLDEMGGVSPSWDDFLNTPMTGPYERNTPGYWLQLLRYLKN